MNRMQCLRLLLAGIAWVALLAAPSLPLPGAGQVGFTGSATAGEAVDVDYFYDELDPYGEWVWHPRYEYVWLPGNVREDWRPYTVGEWVYTEDQGWFWDSDEPFAWAVYHYGRWGYDPDYGWFWVPGDTWAPAWVQWRYSDDYVGWAPIGPHGSGYAYGAPVSYDPPVAEAWVFVQPRYITSPRIYDYALSVGGLSIAFLGATNVYRPIYRSGLVLNFGIPRNRVVKVVKRPIKVQKVVRVTNKTVIKERRGKGRIAVFAPSLKKNAKPRRAPKRFAANPNQAKRKAKLKSTFKGKAPKGAGVSATKLTPVAKQVGPKGFQPKKFGKGGGKGKGKGKKSAKSDAKGGTGSKNKPGIKSTGPQGKVGATSPGGGKPKKTTTPGTGNKNKKKTATTGSPKKPATSGSQKKGKSSNRPGSAKKSKTKPKPQAKTSPRKSGGQGANKNSRNKPKAKAKSKPRNKPKSQAKAPNRNKQSGGGGGKGGKNKKKSNKCKKNPNAPGCRN